jgi:hypothetical protein
MDIRIQSYKTDMYKNSVINMGTKVYNKVPGYIKEIDNYKAFKKVEIISSTSGFLLSRGIFIFVPYNI